MLIVSSVSVCGFDVRSFICRRESAREREGEARPTLFQLFLMRAHVYTHKNALKDGLGFIIMRPYTVCFYERACCFAATEASAAACFFSLFLSRW